MQPPTVKLPSHFDGRRIGEFANSLAEHNSDGRWPPLLRFDFRPLTFIRPVGLTFLSNSIHWLSEQSCRISFANVDPNNQAHRLLDGAQFFTAHARPISEAASSIPTGLLPLRPVIQSHSHAWLRNHFRPWIHAQLGASNAAIDPIQTAIQETFLNIHDHTQRGIGSVFMQHFPAENSVQIGIADYGAGIPTTVQRLAGTMPDSDAICLAFEEGFTTKSTPRNRGAGLDYLLRAIVQSNGGCIFVYSGNGIVRFVPSSSGVNTSKMRQKGFCPGTTIEILLRTAPLRAVAPDEEDLEW